MVMHPIAYGKASSTLAGLVTGPVVGVPTAPSGDLRLTSRSHCIYIFN